MEGGRKISNIHSGHRKRVKQEFEERGLAHFPDHKILEMLLFYSIPRNDTNELGHRLIDRFGSLSGVFDAPMDLLQETKGLGKESAILIKFISQLMQEYVEDVAKHHNIITDAASAKQYMSTKFVGKTTEHIYIACLAFNGQIVYSDVLSEGTPDTVMIRPVDVVKTALRANAVKIVLSHNHPHGVSVPSRADITTTNILYKELQRVDIELFDHVIVAPDSITSMREDGLIANNY